MRIKENTRQEIEARLSSMGDYVKMEYLSRCLKQHLDFDTKRFVILKLASLYEGRSMFLEAGKLLRNVADIEPTQNSRINDLIKSAEMFVKAGNYEEAEMTIKRALNETNEMQKREIKLKFKEMLKNQAKIFSGTDKRKHAMKVYEYLLTIELDPTEKKEIQEKLLKIYENLGKIKEFYSLKRALENPSPVDKPRSEREKYWINNSKIDDDIEQLLK